MALFLNEKDVSELLSMEECIEVLEKAFKEAGQGWPKTLPEVVSDFPKGSFTSCQRHR